MKTLTVVGSVMAIILGISAPPLECRAATYAVEAGDILVASYRAGGNQVIRVNPLTGVQRRLGTFEAPTDLALAPDGALYVSEWNGTIKRLNLVDGTISIVNTNTAVTQIWGLARGPSGDLFVTSSAGNRVWKINPSTRAETLVTQGDRLSLPMGIDFLDAGHLAVASMLNSRIVAVTLADQTQTVLAPNAHAFNEPWGIAVFGTNIYVGAHDSKLLQRVTGTNVTPIAQLAGAPFGIAVDTNEDIVVGVSGGVNGPFAISRINAQGDALADYSGGWIGEVTGLEIASTSVVAQEQPNTAPQLDALADWRSDEGSLLAFTATASDTNWPFQNLTFSLEPGAPDGAAMSAEGVFTWTPDEPQGPGEYVITVKVTDDGTPPASTTASFTVTVDEINTQPGINPLTNLTVVAGSPIAFTATATDLDVPVQGLTFSLGPNAPAGANISASGQFTWTPTAEQAPGTYEITVEVTDDGTPPLTASASFTITVNAPNQPPVINPIADKMVNEVSLLSFAITATDANLPAQSLSFSLLPPIPPGARLTAGGLFTWTPTEAQGPATNQFTVMVTDDGIPSLSDTNTFTVIVNEVNRPPTLAPLSDTNVMSGTRVSFVASATDPDWPAQALTYSLAAGAPAGAVMTPDGTFSWTPGPSQAPSTNTILVRVTDDGTPPLAATQSVTITVRASLVVYPGDILVADNGGNTVYKVNPQTGEAQPLGVFDNPTDVAISPSGEIYVSEWRGLVKRLDLATATITEVNPGTTLDEVWGMAIGPSGEVFVTSSLYDRVVKIDPLTGLETLVTQSNLLSAPYGIAVLDSNHLVVASFNNGGVVKVSLADQSQTPLPTVPEVLNAWATAVHGTNIYAVGFDQLGIETISGGSATILGYTVDLPYGLAVDTNGDVVIGVIGDVPGLTRMFSDGTSSTLYLNTLNGPLTGVEIATVQIGTPPASNSPPVIVPLATQTVDEGTLLSVMLTATDADAPPQTLTFTLGPGAPAGAQITSQGLFTWTPGEADGPDTHVIQVVATDDGAPLLSATQDLTVVVNELYLQSCATVPGTFQDATGAVYDREARTITIPRTEQACFFRLRCNLPVRITRIRIVGQQVVLDYQYQ